MVAESDPDNNAHFCEVCSSFAWRENRCCGDDPDEAWCGVTGYCQTGSWIAVKDGNADLDAEYCRTCKGGTWQFSTADRTAACCGDDPDEEWCGAGGFCKVGEWIAVADADDDQHFCENCMANTMWADGRCCGDDGATEYWNSTDGVCCGGEFHVGTGVCCNNTWADGGNCCLISDCLERPFASCSLVGCTANRCSYDRVCSGNACAIDTDDWCAACSSPDGDANEDSCSCFNGSWHISTADQKEMCCGDDKGEDWTGIDGLCLDGRWGVSDEPCLTSDSCTKSPYDVCTNNQCVCTSDECPSKMCLYSLDCEATNCRDDAWCDLCSKDGDNDMNSCECAGGEWIDGRCCGDDKEKDSWCGATARCLKGIVQRDQCKECDACLFGNCTTFCDGTTCAQGSKVWCSACANLEGDADPFSCQCKGGINARWIDEQCCGDDILERWNSTSGICCAGAFTAGGNCCSDADCIGNYTCQEDFTCSRSCRFGFKSCGGNCYMGDGVCCNSTWIKSGTCCGDQDCPHDRPVCDGDIAICRTCTASIECGPDSECCGGKCYGGHGLCCDDSWYTGDGVCCGDADCTEGTTCFVSGHRCSAIECQEGFSPCGKRCEEGEGTCCDEKWYTAEGNCCDDTWIEGSDCCNDNDCGTFLCDNHQCSKVCKGRFTFCGEQCWLGQGACCDSSWVEHGQCCTSANCTRTLPVCEDNICRSCAEDSECSEGEICCQGQCYPPQLGACCNSTWFHGMSSCSQVSCEVERGGVLCAGSCIMQKGACCEDRFLMGITRCPECGDEFCERYEDAPDRRCIEDCCRAQEMRCYGYDEKTRGCFQGEAVFCNRCEFAQQFEVCRRVSPENIDKLLLSSIATADDETRTMLKELYSTLVNHRKLDKMDFDERTVLVENLTHISRSLGGEDAVAMERGNALALELSTTHICTLGTLPCLQTCITSISTSCIDHIDWIKFVEEIKDHVELVIIGASLFIGLFLVVKRKTLGEEKVVVKRGMDREGALLKIFVKVENGSTFPLRDVKVELTSPAALAYLEPESNVYMLGDLESGDLQSAIFKMYPLRCVSGEISGVVTYKDDRGRMKSQNVKPVKVSSVCPVLEGYEVEFEKYDNVYGKYKAHSHSVSLGTDWRVAWPAIEARTSPLHVVSEASNMFNGKAIWTGRGKFSKKRVSLEVSTYQAATGWTLNLVARAEEPAMATGLLSDLVQEITKAMRSSYYANRYYGSYGYQSGVARTPQAGTAQGQQNGTVQTPVTGRPSTG